MNKKIRNIGIALGILVVASIVAMAATEYAGIIKTTRSPGYSAMFGNFVEGNAGEPIKGGKGPGQVINVSFYLPVDSYVYVSSSGGLAFSCGEYSCPGTVRMWIAMDGLYRADWDYNKFSDDGTSGWSGFSISAMYKLKKGYHTVYLYGESNKDFWPNANIVVIATQKGTISGSSWYTG